MIANQKNKNKNTHKKNQYTQLKQDKKKRLVVHIIYESALALTFFYLAHSFILILHFFCKFYSFSVRTLFYVFTKVLHLKKTRVSMTVKCVRS